MNVDGRTIGESGFGTLATSSDGRSWVQRRTPRLDPIREIVCRARTCVAVGDQGAILRSTDLAAWWAIRRAGITPDLDPACTPPAPLCNDLDDVSFDGRKYVVVTHPASGVLVSSDLVAWTRRETGLPVLQQSQRGLWSTLSAKGLTFVGGGGGSSRYLRTMATHLPWVAPLTRLA